jgi:hypothetical protein
MWVGSAKRRLRFFGLLFSLLVTAQVPNDSSHTRYRVLRLTDASTVLRRVNEAALDGYRVRALVPEGTSSGLQRHLAAEAGATVILERVASPLEPFQYLQLAGKGGSTLQQRLNEAGAQGFRVLPRNVTPSWGVPMEFVVLWMEKAPSPARRYQYLVIDMGVRSAFKASLNPKLWASLNPLDYVRPELEAAAQQGYRAVQLSAGTTLVMEKSAEDKTEPQATTVPAAKLESQGPYRSLGYSRPAKLQDQLHHAAAAGYHVADINPNPMPLGPAVLLEKASGTYDYLVLEAKGLSALEKELNAAPTGFRILPQSLRFSEPINVARLEKIKVRAVMEKAHGLDGACEYQLLTTTNYEELHGKIMKASDHGYQVSGLWNAIISEMIPGQSPQATPDLLILIMERTEEAQAEKERP